MGAALALAARPLRYVVVPAWIAAAVASVVYLPSIGENESSPIGGIVARNSPSLRTEARDAELFRAPMISRVAVVQRDPEGLSAAEQARVAARALSVDTRRDPLLHSIAFALPIVNTGRLFPSSRESGTTAITYLYYRREVGVGARIALAETYAKRIRDGGDPVAGVTGTLPARVREFRAIQDALPVVVAATIAAIALILTLAYRSPGPAIIALAAAGIAYLISVRLLAWIGREQGVTVPKDVEPVVVALLLGLMTDYAIFFCSGVRRRLAAGMSRLDATSETVLLIAPIVATAGLIVALGSATLLLGELRVFRAFGPGMAVTVLVTLAVALTFVPAALSIFGRTLFWPGLSARAPESSAADPAPGRLSTGAARVATWRPVALVLAAVAVGALAIGAWQAPRARLGFTLIGGQPAHSPVRVAADAAAAGFAPGIVAPMELLLEGSDLDAKRAELLQLQTMIGAEPGIAGVVGPALLPQPLRKGALVTPSGDAARLALVLADDPLGAHAVDTLERLQERLPSLLARSGLEDVRYGFGGDTALAQATIAQIHGDVRRIALGVLAVNFVLLALFLRALAAPLYLLAASALGLAATLGLTTWLFQGILGHEELTYYVPFAVSVLLLSLGSDYNLFVVGRIWQEANERPLRQAVAYAAPRASRAITIAAVALAASFAMLALVPIRPMREFAFAMSAGILIDAFIVRTLLVPALIVLFGPISWWPRRRRPVPAPSET